MPSRRPERHSARKAGRVVEVGVRISVVAERACQDAWALEGGRGQFFVWIVVWRLENGWYLRR